MYICGAVLREFSLSVREHRFFKGTDKYFGEDLEELTQTIFIFDDAVHLCIQTIL